MVTDAFTVQFCVVCFTCGVPSLYCGCPSYPMGPLVKRVQSHCMPTTAWTGPSLIFPLCDTVETKKDQTYSESSNFAKCFPSPPNKKSYTKLLIMSCQYNNIMSIQAGMDRCVPFSAVLRKPAPALKLFVNASTMRLDLDQCSLTHGGFP